MLVSIYIRSNGEVFVQVQEIYQEVLHLIVKIDLYYYRNVDGTQSEEEVLWTLGQHLLEHFRVLLDKVPYAVQS